MKKINFTNEEIKVLQIYLDKCNICRDDCVIETNKECEDCKITKIIDKLKEKLC